MSQHKCILLQFCNCFYFCQVFKTAWVINRTDSTSTFKFLVLIVLFCIKCLQLSRFKAKCCRYFNIPEFCELIRVKRDEFLSFILYALFYTVILTHLPLNVVFSLNLNFFSHFFSYICMPFLIIKYCFFIVFNIFLCIT